MEYQSGSFIFQTDWTWRTFARRSIASDKDVGSVGEAIDV
jgi:hypothetical protein